MPSDKERRSGPFKIRAGLVLAIGALAILVSLGGIGSGATVEILVLAGFGVFLIAFAIYGLWTWPKKFCPKCGTFLPKPGGTCSKCSPLP